MWLFACFYSRATSMAISIGFFIITASNTLLVLILLQVIFAILHIALFLNLLRRVHNPHMWAMRAVILRKAQFILDSLCGIILIIVFVFFCVFLYNILNAHNWTLHVLRTSHSNSNWTSNNKFIYAFYIVKTLSKTSWNRLHCVLKISRLDLLHFLENTFGHRPAYCVFRNLYSYNKVLFKNLFQTLTSYFPFLKTNPFSHSE